MRLWHQDLIPYLPRQFLLAQHRECCALRGRSWGRKHSTIDYVFRYPPSHLFLYHCEVLNEFISRRYNYDRAWPNPRYRGLRSDPWPEEIPPSLGQTIFPEHNPQYLSFCLKILWAKIKKAPPNRFNPTELERLKKFSDNISKTGF